MLRKIAMLSAAGAMVLTMALPAGAKSTVDRKESGTFQTFPEGGNPKGSADVKLRNDGSYRVRVKLTHVDRPDYVVGIGSWVDANGDGVQQWDENRGPVQLVCDLAPERPFGRASCGETVDIDGQPTVVSLGVRNSDGSISYRAWALLK